MEEKKIVEIRRYYGVLESAQKDPEVQEYLKNSFKAVGPYWQDRAIGTGLTSREKKILMPKILHIESSDRDFRKSVDKFFSELLTLIPGSNKRLEIGLMDEDKPLSEDNLPISVIDYVRYKFIKSHPSVAENETMAASLPHIKKFYIFDKKAKLETKTDFNKLEDEASSIYLEIKNDKAKVDQILTLLGVNIRKLTTEEKILELKKISKFVKETPEEVVKIKQFIKISKNKDLEIEYMITELISSQILERVGTNILIKETGETLGEDMKDTVLFLKNPKNSKQLLYLNKFFKELIKTEERILTNKE